MRILIVSEVFHPESFLINDLAREWVNMGHQVEVLTQYPSYPQSYVYEGYQNDGYSVEEWEGVKIHRFHFVEGYKDSKIKKFANYLLFIHQGKMIARKIGGNFDVVFVSQTGPLTVAYPALAVKKKYGTQVAIWTYDIWPDVVYTYGVPKNALTSAFLNRVIRSIYNRCDKIFISSKRFAGTIGRYTDKSMVYAPNWLRESDNVPCELQLDGQYFHFTFTGNVSRYQNLNNVVRGFAKAHLKDVVLNIVGDGSAMESLKECIAQYHIQNVLLRGRFPYEQMNDLLEQSDVLLLPLIANEGIEKTEPLKIQSYLSAGKPIFGVCNGSGKDIIEENQLGLCAQPDNVDDIARGFQEMVAFAKEHAKDIKAKSTALMHNRFNKTEIVMRITRELR